MRVLRETIDRSGIRQIGDWSLLWVSKNNALIRRVVKWEMQRGDEMGDAAGSQRLQRCRSLRWLVGAGWADVRGGMVGNCNFASDVAGARVHHHPAPLRACDTLSELHFCVTWARGAGASEYDTLAVAHRFLVAQRAID